MIIDVHCHLGYDYTFDEEFPLVQLLYKKDFLGVDVQIVQPGVTHDLEGAVEQHNAIDALCKAHPGHFFGMANPNPHLSGTKYEDEIARCVEELGFVGVKLHTYAAAVHPGSAAGRRVFDAARKYGIPVMVHTGSGMPFASPTNLIDVAKDYPDVKVVMAHCGMSMLTDEAGQAFAACPNIYGDTSWTKGYLIRRWVRKFGPRVMLASDLAENTGTELAKIRTYGFTPEEQRAVFETTALEVYRLRL